MMQKLLGAVLIIVTCGGFGFYIAARHKREVHYLQKLLRIIELMEWELEYRLTPLPQLCRCIASKTKSHFSEIFLELADALGDLSAPDVSVCMDKVLSKNNNLPTQTTYYLNILGQYLGQYNIDGQLKSLQQLRMLVKQSLEGLEENQTQRLRCYQTLGVCAGAALAILFV